MRTLKFYVSEASEPPPDVCLGVYGQTRVSGARGFSGRVGWG
jgi:hypothetical protein